MDQVNRYLFLDVDGVLNCKRDYQVVTKVGGPILNQEKCAILLKGLEGLGVKVVLSSTWRKFSEDVEFLQTFIPIYSKTPDTGKERGYDIKTWLDSNPSGKYVIVDDDGDMLLEQLPHFIQTTFEDGLTESHVHRIRCKFESSKQ